eukprot:2755029-Prymnesium_polylepis.1
MQQWIDAIAIHACEQCVEESIHNYSRRICDLRSGGIYLIYISRNVAKGANCDSRLERAIAYRPSQIQAAAAEPQERMQ